MPQYSQQPIGGADSNTIYVTDSAGNVNVVNVQTGNYVPIQLGGSSHHATLSQDGKHLYITQSTKAKPDPQPGGTSPTAT